jgi:hypothetical protein
VATLSPENVRFGLRYPDLGKQGIFITFRSKLKGFCGFYHGTNVGTGSPKALTHKVPPLSQMNHSCVFIKAEFYWVFYPW